MALEQKISFFLCPENHKVELRIENYVRDWSENILDADGKAMCSERLHCGTCNKDYEFKEYTIPEEIEILQCPANHSVEKVSGNFVRQWSKDEDGKLSNGPGYHCSGCRKSYALADFTKQE